MELSDLSCNIDFFTQIIFQEKILNIGWYQSLFIVGSCCYINLLLVLVVLQATHGDHTW